jgi:hypothetical protein
LGDSSSWALGDESGPHDVPDEREQPLPAADAGPYGDIPRLCAFAQRRIETFISNPIPIIIVTVLEPP